MKPKKIKDNCLETLQRAVVDMTTPEWNRAVAKLPKNQRNQALLLLLEVHSARVRLENAKLEKIAAKLKENEEALAAATKEVKKALKNLKKIARVVKAVNKLLKIVAKIV